MVLGQGLGLYKGGEEIYKYIVRLTVRKRMGPKQNTKEYWETIYRNTTLARLTLKRYIGVKGIKANVGKRNLSHNIVSTIGGKHLKALKKSNKGRKYNSNTFKDGNNRTKRLDLLGGRPSRQLKV